MENDNNLRPEDDIREENTTPHQEGIHEEVSPAESPSEVSPVESSVEEGLHAEVSPEGGVPEELAVVPVGDIPAATVIAPVKKKTALYAAAAVVLAVCAVAGFALFDQSPKDVVLKAVANGKVQSEKQTVQMAADFPVLAKAQELQTGGRKSELSFTLNSLNIPGAPPMVTALLGGAKISGVTLYDEANTAYRNSYGLQVLGQKIGSVDLFTSPSTVTVASPEYLSETYVLDVDRMVEEGWESLLFTEIVPAKKADLQNFVDEYRALLTSMGAMNQQNIQEMQTKLAAIGTEGMANAKYAKVTEDGKKLYNVTLPAVDAAAMLEKLVRYLYLDSPLSRGMPGNNGEMAAAIDELSEDLLTVDKNAAPVVVKLDIQDNLIRGAYLRMEEVDTDTLNPIVLDIAVESPDAEHATVTLHFDEGTGADKVAMDVAVDVTIADKVMEMRMDMNMLMNDMGSMKMGLDYSLDGSLPKDNMDFDMNMAVSDTALPEGVTLGFSGKGDYILENDAVVFQMDDIVYTVGVGDMTVGMGIGIRSSLSAFAETLRPSEGMDMLTMGTSEMMTLGTELDGAGDKLMALLLGGMGLSA